VWSKLLIPWKFKSNKYVINYIIVNRIIYVFFYNIPKFYKVLERAVSHASYNEHQSESVSYQRGAITGVARCNHVTINSTVTAYRSGLRHPPVTGQQLLNLTSTLPSQLSQRSSSLIWMKDVNDLISKDIIINQPWFF
jgi:hypothetical protein